MNNLNYKHLRYFWMVAKTGSIARAAKQLHLTPQSISGQLTEFASLLGVDLFRRAGRNLEITDAGKRVLSFADEIFLIGDELIDAINDQQTQKTLPFKIGIADSVSKSIAYRLIEPALKMSENIRLLCREGRLVSLLSELAVHELDMIIADSPMPPHLHVRGFNHLIGESGISVFGTKKCIKKLHGKFPNNLHLAPFLLPNEDSAIRLKLNQWFAANHIHINIVGEFSDSALMKAFGQASAGLFVAPSTIAEHICEQYKVSILGEIPSVIEQMYVITTERKLTHPAIIAISDAGKNEVFGKNN